MKPCDVNFFLDEMIFCNKKKLKLKTSDVINW